MTIETTTELVLAASTGDRAAFERLVHRHAAVVTGVAYSVCGDFSLSEDIGQETFVEAWKNLSSIQEPEKFPGWICTVARRRAIDAVRAAKATREDGSLDSLPTEFHDPRQPTPEAMMSQDQERELVWSLLARLPEAYREPMVLFYRCEESTREVAIALGENESTIRQRLKRGREMVRADVSETIRQTLCETAPKAAFAALVMATLPSKTYAAGAMATAAATGKASGGAATATSALAGSVLGPLIGLAGGAFGTWMSWKNCEYERQQKFIVRQTLLFVAGLVVFLLLLGLLVMARTRGFVESNTRFGMLLIGLLVLTQAINCVWIWRGVRGYKRIADQAKADGEPVRESVRLQREAVRLQTQVTADDGRVTHKAFRWNAGGWFGSGLGASVWMLPLAFAAVWFGSTMFASLMVACYLAVVVLVVALWRRRQVVHAYTALQTLIAWIGFQTILVLGGIQFLANPRTREFAQWTPWSWLVLLMFPVIALQLWWTRKSFQRHMQGSERAILVTGDCSDDS
ncbi:RNA polymerase sigma factor [Neorhodopirellula pilleata]|uniref:RNA polymerase sigma factor n=1 Tax=Neorhodopirellula pilleata TaxID=2714738 RepID=UPI0018CD5894|nr:sigma-70 family RNA polymerase sigma factor [Neorhodopirellula pilleata]